MSTKEFNFNAFDDVYQAWLLEFKDNILLKKIAQDLKGGVPDEKVQHELASIFNLLHSRVILKEKSLGEKSLVGVLPRSLALDGRESTKQLLKSFTSFVIELFASILRKLINAGELTDEGMNEQIKSCDHILQAIDEAVNQDDKKVIAAWKMNK